MQRTGARRLWLCQSFKAETHQVMAYLAGMGHNVPLGTSVTLLPLRHPYEAALQARSLALLTGEPVVAGYGIGNPGFVAGLTGSPYASPRTAVHDYLTSVRALLDGERVEHDGPTTDSTAGCCRWAIPASRSVPECCGREWHVPREAWPMWPSPG